MGFDGIDRNRKFVGDPGVFFFFFMLANIINVLLSMNVNQCILFVYLRIFLNM